MPGSGSELPPALESRIEELSGASMDNVRGHYNASKPAQLDALAHAQGPDIHVAPGQERHVALASGRLRERSRDALLR